MVVRKMRLEDLVDKEPYRKVDGDICKPNIVYLDADTNNYMDCYYEPRGFNDQITHHYKYNGALYCWYKRMEVEKNV